eukprot:2904917-Pleurochrysis_carterae.AAC.4
MRAYKARRDAVLARYPGGIPNDFAQRYVDGRLCGYTSMSIHHVDVYVEMRKARDARIKEVNDALVRNGVGACRCGRPLCPWRTSRPPRYTELCVQYIRGNLPARFTADVVARHALQVLSGMTSSEDPAHGHYDHACGSLVSEALGEYGSSFYRNDSPRTRTRNAAEARMRVDELRKREQFGSGMWLD